MENVNRVKLILIHHSFPLHYPFGWYYIRNADNRGATKVT
jgi:hypothetical protein